MNKVIAHAIVATAMSILLPGCARESAEPERTNETTRSAKSPKPAEAREWKQTVPSPAGAGAAEPFLFTVADGIGLSWLEPVAGTSKTALRFSFFRKGSWTRPQTLVERDDLFVNWADFPSIIADESGALFAHWLQKSGKGTYSYDVRMAVSRDGGDTWTPSFLLNRDGRQSEHGFVTLAPRKGSGIAATWLDGRNMNMDAGHDGHDAGDMTLRYAEIDVRGNLESDVELDARTCECCTTGMTMTADGPVIVYRDRSAEEVRDISYVRRTGTAWSKPALVRNDGWKIAGCPVNGPQIDSIGTHAVTAWFTAAGEKQRVYASFSKDGGRTWDASMIVDDGRPAGRVDVVMLDEQSAVVSWLEQTAGGAEIRARRIGLDGTKAPSIKIAAASPSRSGGFTRIARRDDLVWFAWTEQGKPGGIQLAHVRF